MSIENGLERAKTALYGAQVNLEPDDSNLGPANVLLYVAKFQRLVEKPVIKTGVEKQVKKPIMAITV
jgi:hypothetical protein